MKLKIKKEYSEHSIFVKGKRIYFIEMSEDKKEFWFNSGFEYIFNVEEEPVIKEESVIVIEKEKEEKLDLEDDTNK